ncbi:hypothetical protein ACSFBX_33095 [Variovorax sp. RB2P76]|uniref:hypothetical protein n=1 Tax=Variovorax sp. RB2P76 TaxID=3443736 RepID=UPI003F4490A6
MNLAHRKNLRAVKMRPADLEPALPSVLAGLKPLDELQFARRYTHLPLVCVIVDAGGLPVVGPSLFLAACAIKSRGVTGDTPSTYGDCVLDWIRYLDAHGKTLASATEETLQLYRSSGFRAKGVTSATANLRIAVVVQLHTWSQRNGFPSPLGRYLLERDRNDRSLAPRVIRRHPRVMSLEELQRIFGLTTLVFRLAFRWCVTAGLRRFEVAGLTSDLLPPPESLPFCEDGIVKFDLLRKGGKQVPIYAPLGLVEETQWFLITDRMESQPGYENHIFISQRGFH